MKNFLTRIFLSILVLCWFYPNTVSAQDIEKKSHPGWGFSFKLGYTQFLVLDAFSRFLK